jgi:hypothetical protein
MQLWRTIIFPDKDKEAAKRRFFDLVYKEDCIVVAVLGKSDVAGTIVEMADSRAISVAFGFERKVAWLRNVKILASEIGKLQINQGGLTEKKLLTAQAFSISPDKKIADVMTMEEESSVLRVENLFRNAGN